MFIKLGKINILRKDAIETIYIDRTDVDIIVRYKSGYSSTFNFTSEEKTLEFFEAIWSKLNEN